MIATNMLILNENLHTIIRVGKDRDIIIYESDEQHTFEDFGNQLKQQTSGDFDDQVDEDFTDQSQNLGESSSNENKNNEWTNEETKFLLDRYEKYLSLIGPMKRFKNKKNMWIKLSDDLKKNFTTERTPQQVENRYKTIMKRKKKSTDGNRKTGNTRHTIEFDEEIERIAAVDDSIEPEILRGVNTSITKKDVPSVKSKKEGNSSSAAIVLKETLLEIHRMTEEGRQRRHDEKMNILKKLVEAASEATT